MSETKTSDHHLWIEKYRPETIDNIISHKHILNILNRLVDAKEFPHLLFYGPPGTGKTSTILALARKLNGEYYGSMILELNASDNRDIDVIQNCIQDFARTKQFFNKGYKLIILDEADSMTEPAQIALRRIMEEYHRNIRFCLICNYVNRIIDSLQSKCVRFRFSSINPDDLTLRLNHVIKKEHVDIDQKGIEAIIDISNGDLRKSLNILQSVSLTYPKITRDHIYVSSGLPLPEEVDQIYQDLKDKEFRESYRDILDIMTNKGYYLHDIVILVHKKVLEDNFSKDRIIYVLDKLADIEYHLSFGVSEKIQLSFLVAVFQKK